MDSASSATARALNTAGSERRILATDSRPSSTPTSRMSSDTAKPARYSIRPWPKGWRSSARWAASLNPASVTADPAASDRLLKASAVTEIAPVSSPAHSFTANSSRLSPSPIPPASSPQLFRASGSSGLP